jgi:glucose dehydrogenase
VLVSWLRTIVGVLCVLVGVIFFGQGINLIPGSFMTGQAQWAVIGAVLVLLGAWLLWTRRAPAR